MGRTPCCSKVGLHRGPWTATEDTLLIHYIQSHGEGHWRSLPNKAGLLRCGKSCRLRWMNYLRPDIKRGNITPDEEELIVRLHSVLGNRWSLIAGRLGRTDNEIKNYWNTHIKKRLKSTTTSAKETKKQTSTRKRASKCVSAETRESDQDIGVGGIEEVATTKTKVHQPKPIRVSSLSIPTGLCSRGEVVHKKEAACHDFDDYNLRNLHVFWSGEIKVDAFDVVQGYEAEADAERVTMPWQIYEEYEQPLKAEDHVQMESFVDSLLI